MKKVIINTVAAGLILFNSACNKEDNSKEDVKEAKPIELTAKQNEKVSADNRFSFNIFKEVSSSIGANTFFSPLSLNLALGMLYNGTTDETRDEMVQVLGLGDFSETEINEYYQKMSQALLKIDPLTEIGIANSIWYREGYPVKQPFIDINKEYFDAIVKSLDFRKSDAADIINKWCADKTKNRIEEIIEKPIPEDVIMYLINALYFKSKWQFEFDKANTKQANFTKTNGNNIMVNMMELSADLHYYADQYLQCVELPYGNQAFSMITILPNNNMEIDQLIAYLDNDIWQNIINNLSKREIHVKLPRFKIECEIPLNEPVKNVGMLRIFFGGLGNIANSDLAVSNIKQKTFVEVNEEGTEAAAVTVIEISECYGCFDGQFNANRPFLYLIKEKSTGAILFIGRMDEPKE